MGGRAGFERFEDKAKDYKETVRKRAEALKARYPEEIGWMEGVLEEIDYDLLKSTFTELTTKSQVAKEDVNFIPREDIFIVPPGTITTVAGSSAFKINENIILMSAETLLKAREKRGEVQARQVIFYELVHEYCHAVGANRLGWGKFEEREDADLEEKSAAYAKFQTLIEKSEDGERAVEAANSFVLFNEGITDEIAHRVLETYLARTDFFGMRASKLRDGEKEGLFSFSPHMSVDYRTARSFADMIVERISKLCEVPKDVTWNAIIGDYFRGVALPKDLLDEILGRSFTYNLGAAESATDLKDVAKFYNFPDPRPGVIERIKSYLRGGISFEVG